MKRFVLLANVILVATAAFGQSNTCAYTFTFPKYSFQFCLTASGTLAMLQSPIGVNHLDTANPIEGWTWDLNGTVRNGGDVFWRGHVVPAWGDDASGAVVIQPNGPGTLPITFNWGDMKEIVTADAYARSVKLQVVIPPANVWWGGELIRIITPLVDGLTVNNFGHLRKGVFAYVEKGDALVMKTPFDSCFGLGLLSSASGCTDQRISGYGTMVAQSYYGCCENGFVRSLTVTYKIL